MLITQARREEGESARGVKGGGRRGMGGGGGLCEDEFGYRKGGTQTAGNNKSIKANLPRLCNSFSTGESMEREEPWI